MSTDARPRVDSCWSRIGIQGDRSCPELEYHVHCRNCPVYSSGAQGLLDLPVPEGASAEWTKHFARAVEAASKSDSRSALIFRIGREWLGIETTRCIEVAGLRSIHSLPHRRNEAVLGVANVRGELRLCVALDTLLSVSADGGGKAGGGAGSGPEAKRLIVLNLDTGPVVFPVDEVQGVHRFRDEDVESLPATVAKASARYTRGMLAVASRTIGLLDAGRLSAAVSETFA